jgi:hypothetical protein
VILQKWNLGLINLFILNFSLSFQSSSNIYHSNVIYPSRPLNQLISTVNSSKKRNIEELEIEVRNDRNNGMEFNKYYL